MTRKKLIRFLITSMIVVSFASIVIISFAEMPVAPPEGFDIDIPVNHEGCNRVYIHSVTYPINSGGTEATTYVNSQAVGNGEIVGYVSYTEKNGSLALGFVSADAFDYRRRVAYVYYNGQIDMVNAQGHDCTSPGSDGFYWHYAENVMSTSEKMMTQTFATNTYIFDSYANAKAYLETGILNGVIQEPSKEYDGEQVYLDDFQMIVYDSNVFENYYLQFKYSIPEHLKESQLSLVIDTYYTYQITGLSGVFPEDWSYYGTPDCIIDISLNSEGFILSLSDISAINQFINDKNYQCGEKTSKRRLLGSTGVISIMCDLGEALVKIDKSYLTLSCTVIADGRYGVTYNGDVDFLSGSNGMSSFTPDASGEYSYNDDYQTNGYYYTDVGTDESGNPTYGYYYHPVDGLPYEVDASGNKVDITVGGASVNQSNTQTVTFPNTLNVNVNHGNTTPNVTIEDDDMSFSSLVDALKSGFGIIDDVDTGVKGDGFPAMLSYLYNGLPDAFTKIILLGVSSVTAIAILLRLFERK